jgi:hypothetical protein
MCRVVVLDNKVKVQKHMMLMLACLINHTTTKMWPIHKCQIFNTKIQ